MFRISKFYGEQNPRTPHVKEMERGVGIGGKLRHGLWGMDALMVGQYYSLTLCHVMVNTNVNVI